MLDWNQCYKEGREFTPVSEIVLDSIFDTLKHKSIKVKTALDIGCGEGELMRQLKARGYTATGIDLAEAAHLTPPTLIIVGQVVKLHQNLAWFEPASDAENTQAHLLALDQSGKPSPE